MEGDSMKFIYVDESGGRDQNDVFTMCGLMVDAYKLRKKTEDFDQLLKGIFSKYPGVRKDLKTTKFINGDGGWSKVPADERKALLYQLCELAISNGGKIFGIGLSFNRFDAATQAGLGQPFGKNYWLASAMFLCGVIQKRMQAVSESKGLTVVILDDNKQEMPGLAEALNKNSAWYDALYQVQEEKRGVKRWVPRTDTDRFDQIVNTPFAVRSDHSSLVQVADAISYVYRRNLELMAMPEEWLGEKQYHAQLFAMLDSQREKMGRCVETSCVQFFKQACHTGWKL
jgi:hypothetical protein